VPETRRIRTYCSLLFLCAFSVFLASCLSWIMEKPTFVLRGIVISPLSFTEMNFLVDLDVQNPNRFDLTVKSLECTISLEKEALGRGLLQKNILIPSASTTRIQVPIGVTLKDLGGTLKTILTRGELPPYKIEGMADVGTAFGSLKIPFSKEEPVRLGE
jgi:LEA14-like dessication related protein